MIFGVSCVAIAPFKSLADFSPTKITALFVVYLIWPIFCVATYTFSQLLVFRRPMASQRHHIRNRSSTSFWTYAMRSNITWMPILLYAVRSPERDDGL